MSETTAQVPVLFVVIKRVDGDTRKLFVLPERMELAKEAVTKAEARGATATIEKGMMPRTNSYLLSRLAYIEGYKNKNTMLAALVCDSVSPAICTNCEATTEMEPDQDAGYCEECRQNTMKSALILAGMI